MHTQQQGDFLTQYREMATQVLKLNPTANIPPETKGYAAYEAVRDMLHKLQNPPPPPLTAADREWIDANNLQNEISVSLGQYVQRGILSYDDFPFPKGGDQDRLSKLQSMKFRIQQAVSEHNLPPEARVKRLEREFQAFKLEMSARIGGLEQERTNEALRD